MVICSSMYRLQLHPWLPMIRLGVARNHIVCVYCFAVTRPLKWKDKQCIRLVTYGYTVNGYSHNTGSVSTLRYSITLGAELLSAPFSSTTIDFLKSSLILGYRRCAYASRNCDNGAFDYTCDKRNKTHSNKNGRPNTWPSYIRCFRFQMLATLTSVLSRACSGIFCISWHLFHSCKVSLGYNLPFRIFSVKLICGIGIFLNIMSTDEFSWLKPSITQLLPIIIQFVPIVTAFKCT